MYVDITMIKYNKLEEYNRILMFHPKMIPSK